MKRYPEQMKSLSALLIATLFLSVGCADNTPAGNEAMGTGDVAFDCTLSTTVGVPTTAAETKKLPDDCLPEVENFSLKLTNADGLVASYELMSDYDQPMLPAGDYNAEFAYGDPEVEGGDKGCFEGTRSFSIVARKTITSNVTVSLVNSLYSLNCSEWFKKYYTQYEIIIRTESGLSTSYVGSSSIPLIETAPLFVKPGTKLYLSGTATKTNGTEVAFAETMIGTTVAKTWHTIVLDADQIGQAGIVVSLDDTPTAIREIPVELNPDA